VKRLMFFVLALAVAVPVIATEQEAAELRQQAQAASEARNYLQAADLFERADMLHPQLVTAYNAAVCYVQAGSCDAARRTMERLIARSVELRDNAPVRSAAEALSSQPESPHGRYCAHVNRLIRTVDEALGIELETNVTESDARNFAEQARTAYESDDFERAATLYETAHSTYPMLVDALFNAGMAYHLAGHHAEAIVAFRRVVEQSSDDVRNDSEVQRALAEAAEPGNRTSVQLCELASRLRRSIATASSERATPQSAARRLFQRGNAVTRTENYQGAALFYDCSILVYPTLSARFNSVVTHVGALQWDEALRAADAYLAADPDAAADPIVQQARQAVDAEPHADDARAMELFDRLTWAISRVRD